APRAGRVDSRPRRHRERAAYRAHAVRATRTAQSLSLHRRPDRGRARPDRARAAARRRVDVRLRRLVARAAGRMSRARDAAGARDPGRPRTPAEEPRRLTAPDALSLIPLPSGARAPPSR